MDLYQGCSLFGMMLYVMGRGIKEHRPLPFGTSCLQTERKLDEWRRAMEERGLKICRKSSEYLDLVAKQRMVSRMVEYGRRCIVLFATSLCCQHDTRKHSDSMVV